MDDSFQLSDQEAAAPLAARDKPARARKPVTYKLQSDSDSDDF